MANEKLTSNSTTDLTKSIKSGIWYILAAKVSMAVDKMRTALWYAGGHVPMYKVNKCHLQKHIID